MSDLFEAINYKKNFLKQVIVRVDLLNPLPDVDLRLPSRLTDLAVQSFPIPEPRDAMASEYEISPKGMATKKEEHFKEWLFHGKERTKSLIINRQAVFVEHKSYQTFEVVKDEFIRILECISELFPDTQTSRVGLRYVNVIELKESNPTNWSAYLAPQLLSAFQFPPEEDRPALSRVLNRVEFAFDSFNLRYISGMNNPDFPARIRQKAFVMDLDAYTQTAFDLRDVKRVLDDFHTKIQNYFEHSITDELRRAMNAA
jgi:uncharacterized protein (TIGR04255 family)